MKTITTKVYTYDELSDEAKEKARGWYLEHAFDYPWWNSIYDEAKNLGFEIQSFDLYRRECEIKFNDTAENIAKKIIAEYGKDCDTYKAAKAFIAGQKKIRNANEDDEEQQKEDAIEEFRASLAEDYRILLQAEANYMESEEVIAEMMEANEYTFTSEGKRFG